MTPVLDFFLGIECLISLGVHGQVPANKITILYK